MAEIKFSKHTVTNTTNGPKVINAKSVLVLGPGETADVELSDAELASAKTTEWFKFGASKPAAKSE